MAPVEPGYSGAKRTDVVIVNWNGGEGLLECVRSVVEHGPPLVDGIIVVDNDSSDGSDKLVERLQGVSVVRPGENLGFAKACNLGARRGTAEFILFLNPDAQLFQNTLRSALEFLDRPENAKVGIAGVQLADESGVIARSSSRFPTAGRIVARATALDRLFPELGAPMWEWDHSSTRKVDQVIGAFFLMRRRVYDAVGGFDERFFVYYEEVDVAFRARELGWSSAYVGGVRAFHAGGGTTYQVKAKRLFYSLRSRILYAFKHFSRPAAVTVLLATLLIEPVSRSVLAIGRLSWRSLSETWSAYGMLGRWLPRWTSRGDTR